MANPQDEATDEQDAGSDLGAEPEDGLDAPPDATEDTDTAEFTDIDDDVPDVLATDVPPADGVDDAADVSDVSDASDAEADSADAAVEDISPDADALNPACATLDAGWNIGFHVDGRSRSFELVLPARVDEARSWPVVFAWHGFGEESDDIADFFRDSVNGPDYEFILVTPTDTGLSLPDGADWDNLDISDGSIEALLFDELLTCIDERWGVDHDRVHSAGFSSGAITSNMLGVLRPGTMASVASMSGAYWSNAANLNAVASWPDLELGSSYVQLLTWGGLSDSAFGFGFAFTAANDQRYLNERGHDVVACDHGGGHALPDSPDGAAIARFFAAHPRGVEASPWTSRFPEGFPLPWCAVFPGTR